MDRDTKHVVVACFIGGVAMMVVAIIATPTFWWLGLIAGAVAGYISCEFKGVVLATVPLAWRKSNQVMSSFRQKTSKHRQEVRQNRRDMYVLSKPFWPIILFYIYYSFDVYLEFAINAFNEANWQVHWSILLGFSILLTVGISGWLLVFITGVMFGGARIVEKSYFHPFPHQFIPTDRTRDEYIAYLEDEKGYTEKQFTSFRAYRWFLEGLFLAPLFLFGRLLRFIFLPVFKVIALIPQTLFAGFLLAVAGICLAVGFAVFLGIFIYSHKRVLCAIWGTTGGAIVYLGLYNPGLPLTQTIFLVIFGGIIGVAFGVFNWKIVSQKILGIVPVEA